MSDPTRTVPVDPRHAARVVGDFAATVGLATPANAAEAIELLTKLDYAVSKRTLEEFIERKYISDPGDAWDCVAVYCLMGALESRRRYKSADRRHDFKKTGIRLEIERLRAEGIDPPIHDIDDITLEDLLLQITQCDQRAIREALYETLREKLRGYEE